MAIRVPRLADVPEMLHEPHSRPPNVDAVIPKPDEPLWRRLHKVELPVEETDGCPDCGGRGTEHDCPYCECTCDGCGGAGTISTDGSTSLSIGGVAFRLKYVRLLLMLPHVEIATSTLRAGATMLFRFDGGDGAVTPTYRPDIKHLDIDLLAQGIEAGTAETEGDAP